MKQLRHLWVVILLPFTAFTCGDKDAPLQAKKYPCYEKLTSEKPDILNNKPTVFFEDVTALRGVVRRVDKAGKYPSEYFLEVIAYWWPDQNFIKIQPKITTADYSLKTIKVFPCRGNSFTTGHVDQTEEISGRIFYHNYNKEEIYFFDEGK